MRYYKREAPRSDEGKADLLNAERLAAKSERVNALGVAAAKIEKHMIKNEKTHEALGILGAGKNYGAR